MFLIYFFVAVSLQVIAFNGTDAIADEREAYKYLKTIGDTSEEVHWCVQKSDTYQMTYSTKSEMSITRTNHQMDTIQWEKVNISENTDLSALRSDKVIHIKGVQKGVAIDKKLAIDHSPWYQATSWSLRNFILSGDTSKEFWILRTTTLKPYKVLVKKIAEEMLDGTPQRTKSIKVELRIQGLLSFFWESHYWFRKSDGVFLRFEGASGPPGSPLAVVKYLQKITPCNTSLTNHRRHKAQFLSTRGSSNQVNRLHPQSFLDNDIARQ